MLGEIAESFFGGLFRIIGRMLNDIVLEIIIRGTGYYFCRLFSKNVDPDSLRVVVVGLLIWIALIAGAVASVNYFDSTLEVDRCLDAGGRFNDSDQLCEFN